jgi:hypothetical protein
MHGPSAVHGFDKERRSFFGESSISRTIPNIENAIIIVADVLRTRY